MYRQILSGLILSSTVVAPVLANSLGDANEVMCEKVKTCAIAEMQGQEITPEIRDMMQPMLDGMCAKMQENVVDVPVEHPLYPPAVACVESMSSLTCEEMKNIQERMTPACEEFEALAREAGEDV